MDFVIHWFRRDLRLYDNAGLSNALKSEIPVKCIFIFDTNILKQLPKKDRRVSFIYDELQKIRKQLKELGTDLQVYHGNPLEIWKELSQNSNLKAVYTNNDYEPYALERDALVWYILKEKNIPFHSYKDQVIFEKDEVLTQAGTHYTVFTPYSKQWKSLLNKEMLPPYSTENFNGLTFEANNLPTLSEMGFERVEYKDFPTDFSGEIPQNYKEKRDYPWQKGTTRLSTALRFGTVSIRKLVKFALKKDPIFLNELIWREFFMQILWKYPRVAKEAFRKEYDRIEWRNNEEEFAQWCEGKTGYPIVDAGMRELNETGYMHNRVRMVVASFLVKHLLIDWRWGEQYFAEKLMDFDLSANNGNWQWAAGCGTDAAPYFRIFNPTSQQQKFDKDFQYIKKWVKEFGTDAYPQPIVDHKMARERCLAAYKKAREES